MKIINFVVVLTIVVCGSQLSHGGKLDCEFKNMHFGFVGSLYSCYVISLVNPHNNLTIEGYSGVHKANKNDADVKGIYIRDKNTKYIPTNLGTFFNLTVLYMISTQLVEIKAKDFHGMQELEEISLGDNKLSSVPSDAFKTLTKLSYIDLSWNQIEALPNGIFKNNLELKEIHLNNNRIKYLGTEIFHDLKKLNYVNLFFNICVNKRYGGAPKIIQMKHDIKMKCKNPNEVPATTTTTTRRTTTMTQNPTTTTTTQNPMEVKLIEMQEKNTRLEKELREAKELQQKCEVELTNKRYSLIMKLREAKELLQKDQIKYEAMTQELTTKLSKCESMKNSFNISCNFQMTNEEYSCDARDLVIYQKQMELNEVSGTHLKSNTNVTFYFHR